MGTIVDKFEYLKQTKADIKDAIISKGVTVSDTDTFRSYGDKIRQINSEDWKPEPDWWDIDNILENDTEDYKFKCIVLLRDNLSSLIIPSTNAWYSKIVTSDGNIYSDFSSDITHFWDKTKDKDCSLGYKTRYIMLYADSYNMSKYTNNDILSNVGIDGIYVIYKSDKKEAITHLSRKYLGMSRLEAIKFININFANAQESLRGYNSANLQSLEIVNCTAEACSFSFEGSPMISQKTIDNVINFHKNVFGYCRPTSLQTVFEGLTRLKYIKGLDTSLCTNFNRAFNGTKNLISIESLDFNSVTNWGGNPFNCINLINIGSVSNIKLTGLSFVNCTLLNHDTLIRILNALYDYSTDTENTYTLGLGTTNLAKLTDEEKAITTNKGWTLS